MHSENTAENTQPAPRKVKDLARDAGTEAASTAREAVDDVKDAARDGARDLRDAAEQRAAATRDAAAGEIDRTADALREAADPFASGSIRHRAVNGIADHLTDAAHAIRDTDFASLEDDLSRFARRSPALFLGGLAALGFAAARLMKAQGCARADSHLPRHGARAPDHGSAAV